MSVHSNMMHEGLDLNDTTGLMMRLVLTMLGSAMIIAAFALWVVPEATAKPELLLIKLGLSLFVLIAGLCCLVGSRNMRVDRPALG